MVLPKLTAEGLVVILESRVVRGRALGCELIQRSRLSIQLVFVA